MQLQAVAVAQAGFRSAPGRAAAQSEPAGRSRAASTLIADLYLEPVSSGERRDALGRRPRA